MRLEASQGINLLTQNLFRRFGRNGFDLNASFGTCDDDWSGRRAVQEDREITFAGYLRRLGDQHLVYDSSCWTGLMRYQRLPEHLFGDLPRFRGRLAQMNAPLKPVCKCPLPS